MAKSSLYNDGWHDTMVTLASFKYSLERQMYVERVWHTTQKYLMCKEAEQDYAEGMWAAAKLYDRTGHISLEEP